MIAAVLILVALLAIVGVVAALRALSRDIDALSAKKDDE